MLPLSLCCLSFDLVLMVSPRDGRLASVADATEPEDGGVPVDRVPVSGGVDEACDSRGRVAIFSPKAGRLVSSTGVGREGRRGLGFGGPEDGPNGGG